MVVLREAGIAWIVGLVVSGGLYYAIVRAQRTRTAVPTTGVPRRAEAECGLHRRRARDRQPANPHTPRARSMIQSA